MDGKDACVFNLKNYPNMVLRVKRSVLLSIDALSDNLTAVPIKYKDELLQKQDLGIPLYAIVDKKKISAKTKYILPSELSDYNEIMLLKKMEGVHPSDGYFDSLMKFAGAKNRVQQYNFQAFLNSVHSNNGVEFLESCKNGSALRAGLDDVQSFYKNYEDFAKKYLNTISKISELPQGVYDKARDTINASERLNYRFDFDHPLNTVIDFDKNKFSFVDIQLNPEEFKYFNYKYPLEVFRSALLGYGSINVVDDVSKLIVRPEDRKQYEIITKKISEKVFGKL